MPLSRYVFADLNALNDDVRAHMQGRSRQYSQEELALPFPLDPYKLTELLSSPGGEMKVFLLQPEYERRDLLSSCWLGFTTKEYPRTYSLENLLKRNLAEDANGVLGAGKKTLVLVGGELTSSILDRVKLYFTAGWSVQFYCFRERGSEVSDRLHAKYPRHFQSVYLGEN
ncbi:hypothetical protein JG688_00005840 [Phytophthora aleatoria]|uniref:Uncharacterized protein n=1 Tax=Phytophthora aleatoria TaxID=2496075 RepID=A0A8J5JCI5_9STRA|nr:hypothetical protein JG688_00005840 [Phytophthora aleatoria]